MRRPSAAGGAPESFTISLENARAARTAAQEALAQVEARRQDAAREVDGAKSERQAARQAFVAEVGEAAETRLISANDRVVVAVNRLQVLGEDALQAARKRLDETMAAEREAMARLDYEVAKQVRDTALETIVRELPKIGSDLLRLVEAMADASRAVALANVNLPAGCIQLRDAEDLARDQPYQAEEVLSSRQERRWVNSQTLVPLSEADVLLVNSEDGSTGHIPGQTQHGAYKIGVELRDFIVETYSPLQGAVFAARLAGLEFPGLYPGSYYLKPSNDRFASADKALIGSVETIKPVKSRPVLTRARMVTGS